MDLNTILKKYSELFHLSKSDVLSLLLKTLDNIDYENKITELLGYENIEDVLFLCTNKNIIEKSEFRLEYEENVGKKFDENVFKGVESRKVYDDGSISTDCVVDGRKYFKFEYFNHIQSHVFDDVYKTDENVLIAAPTGCGKTEIAILAILRCRPTQENKVVYIAPMKALATEITLRLKEIFHNKVCEFTGDVELTSRDAVKYDIFVCTPEKFEVITRRHQNIFEFKTKLMIIDEIHILQDERGAVIESICSRVFFYMKEQNRKIRLVGLSATLPNYSDVADFIKASKVYSFDDSYRPVSLDVSIVGVYGRTRKNKTRNIVADEDDILEVCVQKANEFMSSDTQILIFTHSRRDTIHTANEIASNMPEKNELPARFSENSFNVLLKKSIMVHHAGLSRKNRHMVENLFLAGHIKILCCTSTLAWGVNLPANVVIIKGTEYYDPTKGKFVDMSILDVIQIFGRAGRPQFKNDGRAILITSRNKLDKYTDLIVNKKPIESQMLYSFIQFLNAEISLGRVKNLADALLWLKNTFLYRRIQINPKKYGVQGEDSDFVLKDYLLIGVTKLNDCGLIDVRKKLCQRIDQAEKWIFQSTEMGRIASHFYINSETIFIWRKGLDDIKNENDILYLMFKSLEFSNIFLRNQEVHIIREYAEFFKMDFEETDSFKMFILVQAFFKKIHFGSSLGCDMYYIVENLERLLVAFLDFVVFFKRHDIFTNVIQLYKKLKNIQIKVKEEKMSFYLIGAGDFVNLKINADTFNNKFVVIRCDGIYVYSAVFRSRLNIFIPSFKYESEILIGGISENWEKETVYRIQDIENLTYEQEVKSYGLHKCVDVISGICNGLKICPHHCKNTISDSSYDFELLFYEITDYNETELMYYALNILEDVNETYSILVPNIKFKDKLCKFMKRNSKKRILSHHNEICLFEKSFKGNLGKTLLFLQCRSDGVFYSVSDILQTMKGRRGIIIEERDFCQFIQYVVDL